MTLETKISLDALSYWGGFGNVRMPTHLIILD